MRTVGFDPKYAQSVTEKEFIEHFSQVDVLKDLDLKAEYAKLNPKPDKVADKSESKEK